MTPAFSWFRALQWLKGLDESFPLFEMLINSLFPCGHPAALMSIHVPAIPLAPALV